MRKMLRKGRFKVLENRSRFVFLVSSSSIRVSRIKVATTNTRHYYSLSIGRSKFSLALKISAMRKRIACEIYLRGRNAKQAFKLLERDKASNEAKTGPLVWMELPSKQDCRIVKFREQIDIEDRDQVFIGVRKVVAAGRSRPA